MEQARAETKATVMPPTPRLLQLMVDAAAVTHIDVKQATAKAMHC
jgi:hypothetical protein